MNRLGISAPLDREGAHCGATKARMQASRRAFPSLVERREPSNGTFHELSPLLNISVIRIQFFQLAGSDERIMGQKNSNCTQCDLRSFGMERTLPPPLQLMQPRRGRSVRDGRACGSIAIQGG